MPSQSASASTAQQIQATGPAAVAAVRAMQTAVAPAPAVSQPEASGQELGGGAMAQVMDEPPAGPGQIMSAAHANRRHNLHGSLTYADLSACTPSVSSDCRCHRWSGRDRMFADISMADQAVQVWLLATCRRQHHQTADACVFSACWTSPIVNCRRSSLCGICLTHTLCCHLPNIYPAV